MTVFPDNMLAGKNCFMAGATSGINRVIARRFAQLGANIYVISRSDEKVQDTVKELKEVGAVAHGMSVDVRDMERVRRAVEDCADKLGPIDMVLAGQAGNFLCEAAKLSANGFKAVVDIDLLGSFNVMRACVDRVRMPGAAMVAITAPQATQAMPMQAHVCAAKAGVNMLVKCLALEWGPSGIRVNAISPVRLAIQRACAVYRKWTVWAAWPMIHSP